MKIFCFGELLLRLSPALNRQWIQNGTMPVFIGGAELNVARALAKWQVPVRYCTALPDHFLTNEITSELESHLIDTSAILLRGNRIGAYYLPQGADLKNTGVIYDRAGSSFSELTTGMIDWDYVLKDCTWFHFSAINPALNENIAAVCKEGLEIANAKGLTISVDLNYRSKLWKYGKLPEEVMPELCSYCHLVMGNIWSSEVLLGIESPVKESAGKTKEELINAAGQSMVKMNHQFPAARTFAYTFRLENEYWAVLQHGSEMKLSAEYQISDVVDKAGSGDCFMAGLIYGLSNCHKLQEIINFAAAAATGKLYEKGDATNQTIEQVKQRMINID